ncbi:MAG: HDIG domain-containing metalloprotein [Calditrichia bacterium]
MNWFTQRSKNFSKALQEKNVFNMRLDNLLTKFILALVLVIIISVMLPSSRPFEYSNLTVGSVAQKEIIAPFTFPIIKSENVLSAEREMAERQIPPVFNPASNPAEIQTLKLKSLFNDLTRFFQRTSRAGGEAAQTGRSFSSVRADSLLEQVTMKYGLNMNNEQLSQLYLLYQKEKLPEFFRALADGLTSIYEKGIINVPKERIKEEELLVSENGVEQELDVAQVLDIDEANEQFMDKLGRKYRRNQAEYNLIRIFGNAFLMPNLQMNSEVTEARKEQAVYEVPTSSGFVYKNQRIVDNHEIITEDVYQKLQSLAIAQQERSATQRGWHQVLFYLGRYLFALLITGLLGLYLLKYRPRLFANNKMLLLITSVLLLQFLFSMLIVRALDWNYLAIPITLAPMLLSMLLDATAAFGGTVVIALVLGAALANNFYVALLTIVVGTIALFSVQKIRNRGQMFRAIIYISLGYLLVNFGYGFLHYESFPNMFQNLLFFQIPNAILTPTAVFLLIGIFEKFFDVTTDITLLELSDLNHPLLKRLSVEAPGTFHHSIIVGNLAEAAAKEVGANSLLARVGCYYHDIGKMQRAEYFVENQTDAMNKHDKLTPTMSSLILSKHVRAGMDMADEYGLPHAVKQFIPEHHGTNLMSFFYHKAKETMDKKDINENDFRYPGPNPQSRETAIAMLADAVEAASRSLPNPNMQRITQLVDNIISQRFQEGQLEECDLTLRDLNKIKFAFIPILMGIHHLRIEYPGSESRPENGKKTAAKGQPADSDSGNRKKQTQAIPEESGNKINSSSKEEAARTAVVNESPKSSEGDHEDQRH